MKDAPEAQGKVEKQELAYVSEEQDADVVLELEVTIPGVFKKAYSLAFREVGNGTPGTITLTAPPHEYYDSMPPRWYSGGGVDILSANHKQVALRLSYYWNSPERGVGELDRNIMIPYSHNWEESSTDGMSVRSRFRKPGM